MDASLTYRSVPGKPKEHGTSYRPILLLCPASKLFERLMIRFIAPHIHLADNQYGFRTRRSTTTVFLPLASRSSRLPLYSTGGVPLRRTVAMAVDSSKAFDTDSRNAFPHILLRNLALLLPVWPHDNVYLQWCRIKQCGHSPERLPGVGPLTHALHYVHCLLLRHNRPMQLTRRRFYCGRLPLGRFRGH